MLQFTPVFSAESINTPPTSEAKIMKFRLLQPVVVLSRTFVHYCRAKSTFEGSTTTLQIPSSLVGDDYYVWIVINPLHVVTEAYE